MNSRQRRGVVLITVSGLCALAAFAGVLALVREVQSKVGEETTAYELKRDVPAQQQLHGGQFRKVRMPERWLPGTAVRNLHGIRGKVAASALHKGSLLQADMLTQRPELQAGEQEIAIMIDAETGVAGKINPGSRVNIYATFEGEQPATGKKAGPNQSKVIVSGAKVLDVGKLTPFRDGGSSETSGTGGTGGSGAGTGPGSGGSERSGREGDRDGVPITFALGTKDAQRVAYAESFAEHVRLALVAPGDKDARVPDSERNYTLSGDS